jgi:glycosyltransferase involved in cell wall biosynthesis
MKPNLLIWSDFFLTGTGFGTVSRYVINALLPHYNIDQLAINYNGEFFDKEKYPVQVSPAKLLDPQDPFGNQMFVNAVQSGKYDYVWIMNDTYVAERVGKSLQDIFAVMAKNGRRIPKVIYYYPIDSQVPPTAHSMLKAADSLVAYSQFGKAETIRALPELSEKLKVITHGVDTKKFFRIPEADRIVARMQLVGVNDPNTFVWMSCNRNSLRKDIAKTILAFSEFKKLVPNSKMYIHTAIRDRDMDLSVPMSSLGLSYTDVIFPRNYAAHQPFPIEVLNTIYNCGDAFITNSLGEGWGLTHLDAAAVKMPIVAPDNTVFTEQLAGRGYLYDCKEQVYIDNQGYRKVGRLDDIVATMMKCYEETTSKKNAEVVDKAFQYAKSIDWNNIGAQWVDHFKALSKTSPVKKVTGTKI